MCQYVRVDYCCHYVYEVNRQLLHEDISLYIQLNFPLLSLLTIPLYEYEVDHVLFCHRGVEMGKESHTVRMY